jgi:tetratricopeptide (TPR) repeat protein
MTSQKRVGAIVLLLVLVISGAALAWGRINPAPLPPTATPDLGAALRQSQADNRPAQTLYYAQQQAARDGWSPALHRIVGDAWRDLGDLRRAAAHWNSAVSGTAAVRANAVSTTATSADPDLWRRLAAARLELQDWPQAQDALAALLLVAPFDTWGHYHSALLTAPFDPNGAVLHLQISVRVAAYSAVSADLLDVVQTNPQDPLMSLRVGQVYMRHRLWPYAELAYEHAAIVGAPLPAALAYVGLARDWQGKDGGPWIARALALDGSSAEIYYALGLHERLRNNTAASLRAFTQAVLVAPNVPVYYAELGQAYRAAGNLGEAERWLVHAVNISGGAAEYQRMLAQFYAQENLTPNTIAVLGQLPAEDAATLASKGWALYRSGDTDGANQALAQALALQPNFPDALYYQARILLEQGQWQAASPLLQQVAASTSEFRDEAQRLLVGVTGDG